MESRIEKKDIAFKCQVCGANIKINEYYINKCPNCGWIQDVSAMDFPTELMCPNRTSLVKARERYKNGQEVNKPDFEDFVDMLNLYAEVEFTYSNIRYGVFKSDLNGKDIIDFFVIDGDTVQIYDTPEEFAQKAHLNNVLLKDLWKDVENANYIQ